MFPQSNFAFPSEPDQFDGVHFALSLMHVAKHQITEHQLPPLFPPKHLTAPGQAQVWRGAFLINFFILILF